MAKEKMSELETKTKEFIFFYEVLGIICVIMSFISLTKLGLIGKYGSLAFRLVFGDWYFLFIGFLGLLGVYFLFVHHRLEIKNIRYLGVIVVLLSLITLSHFTMHEFVVQYDDNELKLTLLLYFDYFKNGRSEMIVGGGILGCLLFYLFYYLFSSIGTIFICIIGVFIGIVFISKKTVFEFICMIKNFFTKCFGGAFSISKKMKGSISKFSKDYSDSPFVNKKLNVKYLNSNLIDTSTLEKTAVLYQGEIKNALNHLNIFYNDVTYLICNHITVYFIYTYQNINFEVLKVSLNKFINEDFLVRYDNNHHTVTIEVNNTVGNALPMKEAVKKLSNEYIRLIIGKDDRNEIIDTIQNIIIISDDNSYYKTYFLSLIMLPMFHNKCKDYDITLVDLDNYYEVIKNKVTNYYNEMSVIKKLRDELDELLYKLDENKVSTIDEYNKVNKTKIKKPLIYLNGLSKVINSFEYLHDLEYFIISGTNIGYQFIVGLTDDIHDENIILKSFPYKVLLKNRFNISSKYLGLNVIDNLNPKIEGFVKYRDYSVRVSLLMIKKSELEKINKH